MKIEVTITMPKKKRSKAADAVKLAGTAFTEIHAQALKAISELHYFRKNFPSCSVSSEWKAKVLDASVKLTIE